MRVEWLDDVVVGPYLEALDYGFGRVLRRDDENRSLGGERVVAKRIADRRAMSAGQVEVEQDKVRLIAESHVDGLYGGPGNQDLETFPPEDNFEQAGDFWFVFGDHD